MFIDLTLVSGLVCAYSKYELRSTKEVLPFSYVHENLIERGIPKNCLWSALENSWPYKREQSFGNHVTEWTRRGGPVFMTLRGVRVYKAIEKNMMWQVGTI